MPPLVGRLQFDLEGNIVGCVTPEAYLSHPVAESSALLRDSLRQAEGSVPSVGVYTMIESMALVRSVVPGQRLAGLRLLHRLLCRSHPSQRPSNPIAWIDEASEVTWAAIWEYLLSDLEVIERMGELIRSTSKATVSMSLRVLVMVVDVTDEESAMLEAIWMHPSGHVPHPFDPMERSTTDASWETASVSVSQRTGAMQSMLRSDFVKQYLWEASVETAPSVVVLLRQLVRFLPSGVMMILNDDRCVHRLRSLGMETKDVRMKTQFVELVCLLIRSVPGDAAELRPLGK